MERLLFLVHRIPYPPNKGDKIRSFNFLKQLASRYEIHLGAFVDDPADWRHREALAEFCTEVKLVGLKPRVSTFLSLRGLVTGEALGLPYYRNRELSRWVRTVLDKGNIDSVLVFSSTMAQYVMGEKAIRRVADFVDVDSEKWSAYGQRHRWPLSWVYAREGRRLRQFESAVAVEFDANTLVTDEEAALLRAIVPAAADRIHAIRNGVDADYFAPDSELASPYPHRAKVLVFTGAMDYWANVDAVTWFAEEVLGRVRATIPDAQFFIVGARPTDAVRRLEAIDGVHVTGAVDDMRPYLQHAVAAVAPLRIARGVQNKVLEAMAMARPVIATGAALEGINPPAACSKLAGESAEELAALATKLLTSGDDGASGRIGREFVLHKYSWASSVAELAELLSPATANKSVHAGANASAEVELSAGNASRVAGT